MKKVEKSHLYNEKLKESYVVITEDYNLSISNIDKSLHRGSEILLSQPNILTNSQISRNPYSMSNMLSKDDIEEVNISRINSNLD